MKRLLLALALTVAMPALGSDHFERDQLFFVGRIGREPVLLAIVLQRRADPVGAVVEAKAFLSWRGRWRTPFYEQVRLPAWPGGGLKRAIDAWRLGRGQAGKLRVAWRETKSGFELRMRRPSGGIRLSAHALRHAGTGSDPHGTVRWRTGPGEVVVNGKTVAGVVIAEELSVVRQPWPTFGRFEMWLHAPPGGGAVLARCRLEGRVCSGRALRLDAAGASANARFRADVLQSRPDAPTHFHVPIAWRVGEVEMTRADGEAGRGTAPGGGPALYEIGAVGAISGDAALVFHLQDEAGRATVRRREPMQ